MDVKEYISSGILDLYVLGALSPDENREVEKMRTQHPEIDSEIKLIEQSLESYVQGHSHNPDPALRAAIIQKIRTGNHRDAFTAKSTYELTYKYLIAACIASLIISTFASVFFYQKWSEAEDRYVTLVNEKNVLTQNMNVLKYEFDKLNHDISVMRDPAISTISMKAADSTKYYKAHIFWNRYTRQTFIDISDLPAPPQGMQYQLWAMIADQPVDAGTFELSKDASMYKVKPVQTADSWVVTLEPSGGSQNPSMDQVILVSKI